MPSKGPIFEPERAIQVYRDVIHQKEKAKTAEHRAEFDAIAKRLRVIWQYWRGADTLHEMAFCEPTTGDSAQIPTA